MILIRPASDIKPLAHNYLPKELLGHYVQLAFQAKDCPVERMWVQVTGCSGNNMRGRLDNKPIYATHLEWGDEVEFLFNEILQIISSS